MNYPVFMFQTIFCNTPATWSVDHEVDLLVQFMRVIYLIVIKLESKHCSKSHQNIKWFTMKLFEYPQEPTFFKLEPFSVIVLFSKWQQMDIFHLRVFMKLLIYLVAIIILMNSLTNYSSKILLESISNLLSLLIVLSFILCFVYIKNAILCSKNEVLMN
jgi:hypothetical protein